MKCEHVPCVNEVVQGTACKPRRFCSVKCKGQAWRANNPLKDREITRKSQRKLAGCVDATGEYRSGNCEICGKFWERLHYDHDHMTGKHRGWLCAWCNRKLGWFEKWREQVLNYLEGQ